MAQKLEVGNVLYNADTNDTFGNTPTQKITIERVTATQAISKSGIKVKRESTWK